MQGKKIKQRKLFINFSLEDRVKPDNFYRRLNEILNLDFLYKATAKYYGKEGQKSIDPVVFMKLVLAGYLENINSDRRIISTFENRMDILLFLGYDIDEEFPWHSTLSRTRKLYGQEQFQALFDQVIRLCVEKRLISGKRQAVDSALVRANASKESMKEIMDDARLYVQELTDNTEPDPDPPTENNDKKTTKRISNQTHFSPSDPDARLTRKPGKPVNLYYKSQLSVDTASHFITYIQAFRGNSADNMSLPEVIDKTVKNLGNHNLRVTEVLADGGYSSGEAIKALIGHNIEGYISNSGNYKHSRDEEGFFYDAENDFYTCPNGAQLTFKRFAPSAKKATIWKKIYESAPSDCRNCPLKESCITKRGTKQLVDTVDKHLYEQMHRKTKSIQGRKMKLLRSSTVEPVFGSLINYTGMSRINSKGIQQANKCMLMAAAAYNLKKLLKYHFKPSQARPKAHQISLAGMPMAA
jgi:transposase